MLTSGTRRRPSLAQCVFTRLWHCRARSLYAGLFLPVRLYYHPPTRAPAGSPGRPSGAPFNVNIPPCPYTAVAIKVNLVRPVRSG